MSATGRQTATAPSVTPLIVTITKPVKSAEAGNNQPGAARPPACSGLLKKDAAVSIAWGQRRDRHAHRRAVGRRRLDEEGHGAGVFLAANGAKIDAHVGLNGRGKDQEDRYRRRLR